MLTSLLIATSATISEVMIGSFSRRALLSRASSGELSSLSELVNSFTSAAEPPQSDLTTSCNSNNTTAHTRNTTPHQRQRNKSPPHHTTGTAYHTSGTNPTSLHTSKPHLTTPANASNATNHQP